MNGGVGLRQQDHPRKTCATLDEVMFDTLNGVKTSFGQRLIKNAHDPIAIPQQDWGQARHVDNEMLPQNFFTSFSAF